MAGRNAVEYAARRACIPWMPCRTRAKLRIFQPLGIALALVAALVATACRAATIDVSVHRSDDTMLIEAHARLDADLATSWDVLTDYAHYPAFIPGLRASRVVARQGASATVEQASDGLWLFAAPMHVVYAVTEAAPSRIDSRIVSGCECTLDSRYSLTHAGDAVTLAYAGRLTLKGGLFAPVERAAAGRAVVREFRALAEEIERRARLE
jgi:ribosome-associated toxin RatA of RatAB toxin-antitoxin module